MLVITSCLAAKKKHDPSLKEMMNSNSSNICLRQKCATTVKSFSCLLLTLSRWFILWTWRMRSRRRPCKPWVTPTTRSCTASWWRRVMKGRDQRGGRASLSCRTLWMSSREWEPRCVYVCLCVCVMHVHVCALLPSWSGDKLTSLKGTMYRCNLKCKLPAGSAHQTRPSCDLQQST